MTSSLNNSFVSVGDKSELDIELELCEELLEGGACNEVLCNSPELSCENEEVFAACYSNELPSENNETAYGSNKFANKEVLSINNSNELSTEDNEVECVDNCNILNKSELDLEFELCEELLDEKIRKEVKGRHQESPFESNDVLSVDNSNELYSDEKELSCVTNYDELYIEDHKDVDQCEDDEISLFAETDVSTIDEFEISILECGNTPFVKPDIDDEDEDLSNEDEDIYDVNNFKLSPSKIKEVAVVNSHKLPTNYNGVSVDNSNELSFKSNGFAVDNSHEFLSKNNKNVCTYDSHELLSDSNVLGEGRFDGEVQQIDDIPKLNKPSPPEVLSTLCKSETESEFKQQDEEITFDHKCEEDQISLFAETDISTLEEFETSILECGNTPSEKPIIGNEQEESKNEDDMSNEHEDIYDPGWDLIKNMSTNEERYKHVRQCWESSVVPDPNRNLTCHSFRKRQFQNLKVEPKPRKRTATSNPDASNPAKRQRSCTFQYDQNIESLTAERNKRNSDLFSKMHSEVGKINSMFRQQEQRMQMHYNYNGQHNYNGYGGELYNLRERCRREVEVVQQQYVNHANQTTAGLQRSISELSNARDEVLNFFKFYKGNTNDPTVLTTSQLRELDEIENVYSQFDKLYK